MKKTHKKIENNLQKSLTLACENIKDETDKMLWLTHEVDLDNVTKTLKVICFFREEEALRSIEGSELDEFIRQEIFNALNLPSFNCHKQVAYCVDA